MNFNYKSIFLVFSALILITMVFCSQDWGTSSDEKFQVPYGVQALNYYTSFGVNDSVLDYKPEPLMKNYGAFVDMVPEAIYRLVGGNLMTIRHMFFAFISFFYIFFGALIAKRIAGWNAAFIAMALLTILPRIMGESLNNPKDPPYAATYIFSIYAFLRFLDSLPNPVKRDYIILGLGFLATMLVRVSGLMAVFYFFIFLVWELYQFKKSKIDVNYSTLGKNIFITGIIGYFSSILFWPSMMNAPFTQPLDALKMLQQYPITLKNLWEGHYIQSNTIPWYYNFKYFLISNPEITLIGILLGFILIFKLKKVYNFNRIGFLLFASLFPLLFIIYKKTALLTGWRHSYFTFVPLVVFGSIAFTYILDFIANSRAKKMILIGLITIGLYFPLSFMARNYSYFYVYFNDAFGGSKKALGNFEMDYYSHSIMPAIKWLEANEPDFHKKKLASNNPPQVLDLLKPKYGEIPVYYTRYRERYDQDWDFNILTHSYIDADYLKNGYFPPKGTVKSIDVDGVSICAIIKRTDKNDFYGKRALDSGNFPKAIDFLTKAVAYDDKNEIAWTNLGLAQLQSNQAQTAVQSLTKALTISPESIMAKNYLGYAYLQSGNISNAQFIFQQMIEENPNMPDPYRILGQIYQQQGNTQAAQQYLSIYQQITSQMGGK